MGWTYLLWSGSYPVERVGPPTADMEMKFQINRTYQYQN